MFTVVTRGGAGAVTLGIAGVIAGLIWGAATPWNIGPAAGILGGIAALFGTVIGQDLFGGSMRGDERRLMIVGFAGVVLLGVIVWIITAALGGDSTAAVAAVE